MIITKYPIIIEIDGVEHKLTLAEPNKQQQQTLREIHDVRNSKSTKLSAMYAQLEEKTEEYSLNKQLLSSMQLLEHPDESQDKEDKSITDKAKMILKKAGDKVSLLLEQKTLNREIAVLRTKIDELNLDAIGAEDSLELAYKERFELLVSGEGKAAVKNIVENYGILYRQLFEELNKKAIELKKKK